MSDPTELRTCVVCLTLHTDPIWTDFEGITTETQLRCVNCGTKKLTLEAATTLSMPGISPHERSRIAHGVSKLPTEGRITRELVLGLKMQALPKALERIDNLILNLATRFEPGAKNWLAARSVRATVGAETEESAYWVMEEAKALGWISGTAAGAYTDAQGPFMNGVALTAKGWERHQSLLKNGAGSRHAFMAMKFNDAELDEFFAQRLKPAVAQTGFELRTTAGDHQTAGSIDDRMRVEIRTSRFLLCDLTHANNGAYWEAGFAEGLGRPVFYICRENVYADKHHLCHPHFDTSHQLIIPWDPIAPEAGLQKLKSAIRATLPDEAVMTDPARSD